LAMVSLLAFQANGAQERAGGPRPSAAAGSASEGPATTTAPAAPATPTVPPLPANSGTGLRVVYSAGSHYVWLVDPKKNPQVVAAFAVTPGTVEPNPGSYPVYSRTPATTGTDGRRIEHVVRFVQQNGVVFGFSALVDPVTPAPTPSGTAQGTASATPKSDPKGKTGGIRSTRQDGQLLWDFAPNGTRVVVIP
ncbi:hypothetical protein ACWEQL_18375, partial [Kitasatospora sp. NPDC004240]